MAHQKQKTPEEVLQTLCDSLEEAHMRWQELYTKGGSDPFYTDGENLSIIRNHILYDQERAEKICLENGLERPSMLNKPIPPKVDVDYMANKDEIRVQAEKTLTEAKASDAYLYLQSVEEEVLRHKKLAEKSHISTILSYVSGLERAITEDDYVSMRRRGRPGFGMMEALERCMEEVKEGLAEYEKSKVNGFEVNANGQFSLFG